MAEVDHEILRIFRSEVQSENKDVSDIIEVKNNIFYLYNDASGDVLVTNSTSFCGLSDFPVKYQVFRPRVRVYGKARALRVSENNARVAVLTDLGLYVTDLPHIWTCLLLPPSASKPTICEVWMVPPEVERMPRVFIYEVLQARWHPRAVNYLLALYNDNFLRLLDVENHTLLRVLSLGRHPDSSLSTLLALNEHAVDFDFLPAFKDESHSKSAQVEVMLLFGNGDVSCGAISRDKTRLNEPMCFKRETNSKAGAALSLTSVACSLIVLPCSPIIVVLAYKSGDVSHCVMLGDKNAQYLKVFEEYNVDSDEKKDSDETKDREGRYILLKDPGSNYRYYVLYAGGIYVVMLPLIPTLENLLHQQRLGEDAGEMMRAAVRETESIVRQLVNTQLGEMTEPRPPYGLAVAPERGLGSRAIALLSDGQATTHRVDLVFPPVSDFLKKPSPAKDPKKQFSAVISNYLLGSKSSRPPVLKVGEALKNDSPESTLQFLRNYVSNLKEDRIKKHMVVAELVEAKMRDISIEYDCQLKQLEKLKSEKESLKQNAERIAELYEERNDKSIEIQKRLELVALKISAPGTSVMEEKMRTELLELKKKTEKLQFALKQSQAAVEHRKSQFQEQNSKAQQEAQRKPTHLNDQRKKAIKQNLSAMGADIEELKERVEWLRLKMKDSNIPHK